MNKKIIFAIIIINLSLILVSGATTQIIGNSINGINYNFSGNQSHNYLSLGPYQNNLLMLRITTTQEANCFFGKNPSSLNEFEGKYGTKHEKILIDLEDGINRYYIRCQDSSQFGIINEVVFSVNIPINGNIEISEREPPLREGQYEILLTTSKTCLETPELRYSLDGITYKQISLKGSDKNWQGYLIIPKDIGEGVGYFSFKAKDMYGGEGNKITGDTLFILDTVKPETVEIIDSVSYQGQIRLDWFYNSDIKEFNIYRSENPPVTYTDFYKSSSKNSFTDNGLEKGKTYYYRIAGIDEAGNIGELSREVYATALYSNSSSIQSNSGLDIKLLGKVDNLISEINSLIEDIGEINSKLTYLEEKEKNLFEEIKLNKEVENAILELNSVKRDVEKYKTQDLTEEELDKKINSASLRINIIKKKVPETLSVLNEKEITREINEENIAKSLLEYYENNEPINKREITSTLDRVKENNIKLTSKFYSIEIIYLDGSKKEITIIKDYLDSQIEMLENFFYIMIIPKEIVDSSSKLNIITQNYEVIKEDPVLSFPSDTKRVTYYIEKEIELNSLEEIIISPIEIISESSKVTGNIISNYISPNSIGLIVLIIFVSSLAIYFLFLKKDSKIKILDILFGEINNVKKLIKEGKLDEAKEIYLKIKEDYKKLNEEDKKKVLLEINKINSL